MSVIESWRDNKHISRLLGQRGVVVSWSSSSRVVDSGMVALIKLSEEQVTLPLEVCDLSSDEVLKIGDEMELVFRKISVDDNGFIEYGLKAKKV